MPPFKIASLALLTVLLTGCASEPLRRIDALSASPAPLQTSAGSAEQALATAPSCCASLRELPYQPIPVNFSGEARIDTSAPAFAFDSG